MSNKHNNLEIKGKQRSYFLDLSTYVFVRFLLSILSILPYPTKIAMGGLIYKKVISPLSGNRKRIIDNLKLVFPNLEKEKRQICLTGAKLCTNIR